MTNSELIRYLDTHISEKNSLFSEGSLTLLGLGNNFGASQDPIAEIIILEPDLYENAECSITISKDGYRIVRIPINHLSQIYMLPFGGYFPDIEPKMYGYYAEVLCLDDKSSNILSKSIEIVNSLSLFKKAILSNSGIGLFGLPQNIWNAIRDPGAYSAQAIKGMIYARDMLMDGSLSADGAAAIRDLSSGSKDSAIAYLRKAEGRSAERSLSAIFYDRK
jgi:hypothetical protein